MNFFIKRPIFAAAIAVIVVLAGSICIFVLPVSQYPSLAPPQINVSTQYIGAGSEVVAKTVTAPLEEAINGSEGMIYMSSTSTNNGDSSITITYEVGYNQNFAQMDVLTRSNQAKSELPQEVSQVGLSITKNSSNMLLAVNLISTDGKYDGAFLQNYADIHITDALSRIPGVSNTTNFGFSKYAIRIWLNPEKLNNMGLTAVDVKNAVEEQNQQVAAGALGKAPAPGGQEFQYQLNTLGRLTQVKQFENIVVRAFPDGRMVRVSDIARVELGAEEYDWTTRLDGKPTATLVVFQLADANGLQIKKQVVESMQRLEKDFPPGVKWVMCYDTTEFIKSSIIEVSKTLIQAILLVALVVFLFLQNFRATLIPTIAVPVSIIGAFAFMAAFGFSINILTLLGLVLAVALVVDDAIVIVENVVRKREAEPERDIREITAEALAEVRGPIIATTLVLMAVFVPVAFIPGMTGMLYNQFSLTIAVAIGISGINSLTLSPALCGVFIKARSKPPRGIFRLFNRSFDKLSSGYVSAVRKMVRFAGLSLLAFVGLCVLTVFLFKSSPTGFVPEEDQGYFFIMVKLPEGKTLDRTQAVVERARQMTQKMPGVAHVLEVSGYDLIDSIKQPSTAFLIAILDPWEKRKSPETRLDAIMGGLQEKVAAIPEAEIMVFNASPIPGIGMVGGFTLELQDLDGKGVEALSKVADHFIEYANRQPELAGVYTTFSADTPQRYLDIDREKAKSLQVPLDSLFSTLQINLGSLYVNEFNRFGRIYRVYLQAEPDARADEKDIFNLKVRNSDGQMINLSALIKVEPMVGPYSISHYNEYNAIKVNGSSAPGFSSGQAVTAVRKLAGELLPEGFGYEWTGMTYQQLKAGNMAPLIFVLSLAFVFLVLAAQYESWAMPVMVLLGIPLGLLGAIASLLLRGIDLNVYGQIGILMLIGLTAKNGILIVEFAGKLRKEGKSIADAAAIAAHTRLRPILMTSLAFVIGLLPLVFASGAGASSRQSLGTTVVGGLLVATILIIFVPVFYYCIEKLRERRPGSGQKSDADADGENGKMSQNK